MRPTTELLPPYLSVLYNLLPDYVLELWMSLKRLVLSGIHFWDIM